MDSHSYGSASHHHDSDAITCTNSVAAYLSETPTVSPVTSAGSVQSSELYSPESPPAPHTSRQLSVWGFNPATSSLLRLFPLFIRQIIWGIGDFVKLFYLIRLRFFFRQRPPQTFCLIDHLPPLVSPAIRFFCQPSVRCIFRNINRPFILFRHCTPPAFSYIYPTISLLLPDPNTSGVRLKPLHVMFSNNIQPNCFLL